MSHTGLANRIKRIPLSSLERELISGCLLGDGTLSQSGKYHRLRIEHASRHKEYVEWKHSVLKRLCVSEIQCVADHGSFRFGTVGLPEVTEMRQLWYRPTKQIPTDLVLTPMMVAIWFMDDGTKHRDTVDISVHSFSFESLTSLRNRLSLLGIHTTVNSDAKGHRLYVLKESYPNFKRLVKPYIVECMAYKLP